MSACQRPEDRVAFDGVTFKTKAKRIDDDWNMFTVTVSPAAASLEGARQAGRYEATRYCIGVAGTSEVLWTVGPETEPLRIDGDTLTFQGECNP
ncbi:MAG TPA: hypothetical protein DEA05_06095 [Rhodobacteraceae bacterium]|nr:hypothetical protein [Paracoccaceae bacterium]